MSLLLRFYDFKPCDMGTIKIDGEDITTHSKRSYRKHVGIVLQDPVLFKGTLADNIRFGVENLSDQDVEDVLVKIGGKRILDKLSDGVKTMVAARRRTSRSAKSRSSRSPAPSSTTRRSS
ncbi:MAG: ATP-binding cassette domain-containing protein [Desulfomicrobium escambiense]|nr:ATP-binding cassette domain-containing protein [Desulfomicrobium escambiense]